MRPTRLELEGFASFRQRTELEFGDDLDLFVFAGPTGSGKCLPGDTRIYDAKTGRPVALGEAVRERLDLVLGLDEGRIRPVPVVDWHELGVHDLLEVSLEGGGRLTGARSHPVLTGRGIVRLEDLRPDDRVAEARHLRCNPPSRSTPEEAREVGRRVGEGAGPARAGAGLDPALVLQPAPVARGLLAGLVTAAGRWSEPGPPRRLRVPVGSQRLARDLIVVARSLGVVADLKIPGAGERWSLAVEGGELRRLVDQLPLEGEAHEAAARTLQAPRATDEPGPTPAPAAGGDVVWRRVAGLARAGRAECFDLTVGTDDRLYVAELAVVHNSSLLDAVCFSLYGSVPRYPSRNWVAPVVSQGANQARVRLTFELSGNRYAATRVVRRTSSGASTREARLERLADGEVAETLAGSAAEVTDTVEELLGLSFEHFVKTVVLPQGAFQEFMHARPGERQDLLVELLGLDVYQQVASEARSRAREAEQTVEVLQRRLDGELAGATEQARDAAEARLDTLGELAEAIAGARPRLRELEEQRREREREAAEARERAGQLEDLGAPEGVEELAARRREAAAERDRLRGELEQAVGEREAAEQVLDELPEPSLVDDTRRVLEETEDLDQRLDDLEAARERAEEQEQAAAEELEEAREAEQAAEAALEHARRADLAATLAQGLEPGADCPVCERPLESPPEHHAAADLEAVRTRLEHAEDATEQARAQARRAAVAAGEARTEHEQATRRQGELAGRLARLRDRLPWPADTKAETDTDGGGDDHDDEAARLDELEQTLVQARDRLADARLREKDAREDLRQSETQLEDLEADHRRAWDRFDTTRDGLAGLEPPAADRDDLAGSWSGLVEWADRRRPELSKQAAEADAAAAEAREDHERLSGRLERACRALSIDADLRLSGDADLRLSGDADLRLSGDIEDRPPAEAVAAAREQARGRLRRITEQLERIAEIREEIEDRQGRGRVAESLGRHLSASRFQRWLLNRALRRLVVGATGILQELTEGAYSLTLDDNNEFEVVDHRSADTTRSARTLSGGETFLASLALALALSEHVAELAAGSAARLDALFLDEGFGTLDAATLDTVAAAVEELGARGRMVGLITHVRDLAERIPVRFEVRKTAGGSQVEKVVT